MAHKKNSLWDDFRENAQHVHIGIKKEGIVQYTQQDIGSKVAGMITYYLDG